MRWSSPARRRIYKEVCLMITLTILLIIALICVLVSWWKNNSFTAAAIQADAWMGEKKKRVN